MLTTSNELRENCLVEGQIINVEDFATVSDMEKDFMRSADNKDVHYLFYNSFPCSRYIPDNFILAFGTKLYPRKWERCAF